MGKQKKTRLTLVHPPKAVFSPTRKELLTLHAHIYKENQARIKACVYGYSPSFRTYEEAYLKRVRTYQHIESHAALHKAIAQCNTVYVGDYHTLPKSRTAFHTLLTHIPPHQKTTVALEWFPAHLQDALNDHQKNTLDTDMFVRMWSKHVPEAEHVWPTLEPILHLARTRQYTVLALDTPAKGRTGSTLRTRDTHTAHLLAEHLQHHPNTLVMALLGDLHIAPAHVPAQVQKRCPYTLKQLSVYQNAEPVYRKLVKQGLEHSVDVVNISPTEWCLLNTPPIVCQQSFLNWVDFDEDTDTSENPSDVFQQYVSFIADFFQLPVEDDETQDVLVKTVSDTDFFEQLQKRGSFTKKETTQLRLYMKHSESCYIPKAKMVYLGNLSAAHIGEEATHFIRHVVSGLQEPEGLVDCFYARCIEEALGFLGSKIIHYKRPAYDVDFFASVAKNRASTPQEKTLARLFLKHVRMEQGFKVHNKQEVYTCSTHTFNALSHALGYRLGLKLYHAMLDETVSKHFIQNLFLQPLNEEGTALTTYLMLVLKTHHVDVPKEDLCLTF